MKYNVISFLLSFLHACMHAFKQTRQFQKDPNINFWESSTARKYSFMFVSGYGWVYISWWQRTYSVWCTTMQKIKICVIFRTICSKKLKKQQPCWYTRIAGYSTDMQSQTIWMKPVIYMLQSHQETSPTNQANLQAKLEDWSHRLLIRKCLPFFSCLCFLHSCPDSFCPCQFCKNLQAHLTKLRDPETAMKLNTVGLLSVPQTLRSVTKQSGGLQTDYPIFAGMGNIFFSLNTVFIGVGEEKNNPLDN